MNTTRTLLAAACAAVLAASAGAETHTTIQRAASGAPAAVGQLSESEALGVIQAANKAEIEAAQAAKDKASSAAVRGFAEQMIEDHTKSQSELATAGTPKDSEAGRTLRDTAQADLQRLQSLQGNAFDQAYMDAQVRAHQTVLDLLGHASSAQTGGIVQKTRDVVASHLNMAERVQAELRR